MTIPTATAPRLQQDDDNDGDQPLGNFELEAAKGKTGGLEQQQICPQTDHNPIVIYTKTEKLAIDSYHPKSFINRTSWTPQTRSTTHPRRPLISLPRTLWDPNQLVPYIHIDNETLAGQGSCVDIVINNLDDGAHPFHLHGHSFWVLRSHRSEDRGWGSFNPYSTRPGDSDHDSHFRLNTLNPVRKDTVSVPRRGHVVIRLWTDNPGIWMLHCHVLVHQASGMAMALHVGSVYEHPIG